MAFHEIFVVSQLVTEFRVFIEPEGLLPSSRPHLSVLI
jgi:hypothetical protein